MKKNELRNEKPRGRERKKKINIYTYIERESEREWGETVGNRSEVDGKEVDLKC